MKGFLFFGAVFTTICFGAVEPGPTSGNTVQVKIHSLAYHDELDVHHLHMSRDGVDHHYTLRRPTAEEVIFHPYFTITVNKVSSDGKLITEHWSPDQKTLESANNVHIDPVSHAVLRLDKNAAGSHKITGITRDFSIHHDDETNSHYSQEHPDALCDYRPAKSVLSTNSNSSGDTAEITNLKSKAPENSGVLNTVELLLFADLELCDAFGQDRRRLLDYYTPIMYDMNLRYLTLPSVQVVFRLSGLVMNSNKESQPYVEYRNEQGERNLGTLLEQFTPWLQKNRDQFPKHDLAAVATKALTYGGVAWGGQICYDSNTFVYTDVADWSSPVFLAHEAGHSLGAPHDRDPDDCNKEEDGYIMNGGGNGKVWFFSTCSDKYISRTLNERDCTKRIDNDSPTLINFQSPKTPSIDSICKTKENNDKAFVAKEDQNNCEVIQCRVPDGRGGSRLNGWNNNVENMVCNSGKGRCFRGFCRTPGYLIKNVESGLCLKAENRFSHDYSFNMVPCPQKKDDTPLNRFVMAVGRTGTTLATPYSQIDGRGQLDKGDKCAYLGGSDADKILLWTDRCGDYSNDWHGFDLVDAGNSRFLLKHKVTKRCVQPESKRTGSKVFGYTSCDSKNKAQLWTRSF